MTDRYYATIEDVRLEGVEQRPYSDKRVRKLIREMSKVVDILTGQWFYPIRETRSLSGEDSPILYDPSLIPILKVFSVNIDYSKSTFHNRVPTLPIPGRHVRPTFPYDEIVGAGEGVQNLGEIEWENRDRYLEMIGNVWPEGANNVVVDGVFGWVENLKEVTTTTVSGADGEVDRDSTQVKVSSVDGIFPHDVVRISKDGKVAYLLISDIDGSNNLLKFDKITEYIEKVDAEADVDVYGRVPELITRATVRLVILNRDKMTTPEYAQSMIQGQIKRERTDNYQYELFTSDEGGGGTGGGSKTTGDAMTDRILQEFTAPLQFRIV